MNMVKHVIFFTHPGILHNIYFRHLITYLPTFAWALLGARLKFLKTARRALQDLLYTFYEKNKIIQVILISHFVIFLESLIH